MQSPQFQAHALLEERHWWFLGRRAIVRELLHTVVPPTRNALVIDVGCGTGGMTAFLSHDYACIGIDPIREAIALASEKFPAARFVCGSAPDDVQEEFGRADAILLLEVLEHVEHDHAFVQSLIAGMKPGAFLIAMAPADMSLWGPHDEGFEHYRRYDLAGLARTWEGAPVTTRLLSYCNSRLYPLAKFLRWIGRRRGKAWGPAQTDLALPLAPLNTLLRRIFSGEAAALRALLEGPTERTFRRGVSVIAVLQKLSDAGCR